MKHIEKLSLGSGLEMPVPLDGRVVHAQIHHGYPAMWIEGAPGETERRRYTLVPEYVTYSGTCVAAFSDSYGAVFFVIEERVG